MKAATAMAAAVAAPASQPNHDRCGLAATGNSRASIRGIVIIQARQALFPCGHGGGKDRFMFDAVFGAGAVCGIKYAKDVFGGEAIVLFTRGQRCIGH
jgi:hypothetical protein